MMAILVTPQWVTGLALGVGLLGPALSSGFSSLGSLIPALGGGAAGSEALALAQAHAAESAVALAIAEGTNGPGIAP